MPVTGSNAGNEKGPAGGGRTTFRPPWVKDGQQSTTSTQKAPWVKKNEGTSKENGQPQAVKETKLQSREIKVPIMTTKPKPVQAPLKPKEVRPEQIEKEQLVESKKDFTLEKPKLRHVDTTAKDKKGASNELPETPKLRPVLKKTPKVEEVKQPTETKPSITEKSTTKKADDDAKNVPAPPPPPPSSNIPKAPPPPPPALKAPEDFQKAPLTDKQKKTLDKLKQRARRRPDWSVMMKEVEDGRKLKHVQCNDRSKPILTSKSIAKVSDQFVYETEKANIHNILLHQIQSGIRLKPTKTNDRSKPILEGLRKFRRQMTIEEQIQKSESRAILNEEVPDEESEDEMDDIDKLRDDLQSTKQMLALELRNKEAQERENKRLQAKIANLEAELEREKTKAPSDSNTTTATTATSDEALVNSLKKDAEDARKTCTDLEKKYQQSAEQLDSAKGEIEEKKRQIATLEKKLSQAAQGGSVGVAARRPSEPGQKESSPEPDLELSESESDEDEEKKEERLARRLGREVKMLINKLQKTKDKQQAAQKERTNLKEAMKKNQALLKDENKKFKKLQKEVDKMAKMLKDDDEDDEEKDEEEEEEEEEAEEEESETEEETETEESEEESGSETESESEDEDASDEDKKANLEPRVKRHEGRLTALKKGNYLLQANVDRLQDEINKIREKSVTLQHDLDSVLSELG